MSIIKPLLPDIKEYGFGKLLDWGIKLRSQLDSFFFDIEQEHRATGWQDVLFGTGWSNYGSGYQTVQYKRTHNIVYIRGTGTCGDWVTNSVIFTLPVDYRPQYKVTYCQMGVTSFVRIEVYTDGTVKYLLGDKGLGALSLDGMFFGLD